MDAELRITNTHVVTPHGIVRGGVAVRNGAIVAIAADESLPRARETIDGGGHHLIPGVIDGHVHFRDPGLTQKEDFVTGSRSAARGGVTTVLEMPNTQPAVETAEILSAKAAHLASRSLVDYGLIGVITDRNLDRVRELCDAGAVAYKIFMGPTTGDLPCPDDGAILDVLRQVAETGRPLGVHAENHQIIAAATARLKKDGRTDPPAHALARPAIAEAESIQRMVLFARETRARVHVFHMSAKEGVELVRRGKGDGVEVTAETCPHYLTLTAADMATIGPVTKINPPLRGPEDVEALWAGLADGTVGFVVTDHAPHTREEKTNPVIWDNASGASSVQFLLPLMLEQVARGRLTLAALVRCLAEAPARMYGLYPKKGAIVVGSDADLTLVDLDRRGTIRAADMESKVKLTPFDGVECRGWPVLTLVRGRTVMSDGKVVGAPGHGRFLRPA